MMNNTFEVITPAFSENEVPVVFSANDSFCRYLAAALQSVMDRSSSDKNYDIIVLHKDITEETMSRLLGMVSCVENFSLRFFNVDDRLDKSRSLYIEGQKRITEETYFRLLIPSIFSDEFRKIIYLDGDLITLVDIADLMDVDMGDCFIAAAPDITGIAVCHTPGRTTYENRKKNLKMADPDKYFIAGLMVMNVPAIKKAYPGNALMKLAFSRQWEQHDQDVLNFICKNGKAKFLHASWNVLKDYGQNKNLPASIKAEWLESEAAPKVVHYGGPAKPWNSTVPRQECFWEALAKTPFFEDVVTQSVLPKASLAAASAAKQMLLDGKIEARKASIEAAMRVMPGYSDRVLYPDTKISIIVPVYGVEAYLDRCMESLLNQTHKNLEIILVDDGSPDNCPAMCDAYAEKDERIVVVHKVNGGLSSARNAGMAVATGEYIGFVDSDDYIELDMYEYLLDGIHRFNSEICACQEIQVSPKKTTYRNKLENEVLTGDQYVARLFRDEEDNFVWNKLYRRDLWDGVDYPEGLNFEDVVTTYKVARKAAHVAILTDYKYYYMIRSSSISGNRSYKNRLHIFSAFIRRYREASPLYPEHKFALFDRFRKYYIHELAWWVINSPQDRAMTSILLELMSSFVREVKDELFATGSFTKYEIKEIEAFAEGTVEGCKKAYKYYFKTSKG